MQQKQSHSIFRVIFLAVCLTLLACLLGCTPGRLFVTTNPTNPTGTTTTSVTQASNDIVWDSTNSVIYVSVPGTATSHADSIVPLNPSTGTLGTAVGAGLEPNVLAISGDSQFLYVGQDESHLVQRYTLPSLTPDISIPLGVSPLSEPYHALDLQVTPSTPHTTAVALGVTNSTTPASEGGIVIFDDTTARPTVAPGQSINTSGGLYSSLQWGVDSSKLYAANNESTGFDFYTLDVSSSGVTLGQDYANVFSDFDIRIHYDSGTNLIYSDDGKIVDPATGTVTGTFAPAFSSTGLMVPDSTNSKAFFLGKVSGQASGSYTLKSFNLTTQAAVDTMTIDNVQGNPLRLIRWGTSGLAFNTGGSSGQIYLISGTFVH